MGWLYTLIINDIPAILKYKTPKKHRLSLQAYNSWYSHDTIIQYSYNKHGVSLHAYN